METQLQLLGEQRIQLDLGIELKRRGNPNFRPKFKAGKTIAMRVPIAYRDRINAAIQQWETGKADPISIDDPEIGTYPVAQIGLDPHRFQYKLVHGATGSTGSLSGVVTWDANLAGICQVWRDPNDGIVYAINGHNRVSLAKQLGVSTIAVRFLKCKDAVQARLIGALTNIAEGRGTAIDAAKLFRDHGFSVDDLKDRGIPLREKLATDAIALSKLSDILFNKVIQGDLPLERAVIIGELVADHDDQHKLVDLIERESKRRKLTNDVIRELAETLASSDTETIIEIDLFGTETKTDSVAIEKAELSAYIRQRLSREKKLFSTVSRSRNASELARGNNIIDKETSSAIATDADKALNIFNRLKNMSGKISQLLNVAAKELRTVSDPQNFKDRLYSEILEFIVNAPIAAL